MLREFFRNFRSRARRERCVLQLVEAVNANDYSGITEFMTEDCSFADINGSSISGRNDFVRSSQDFLNAAAMPKIVVESVDHVRGEVLVRGYLDGGIAEVGGATTWRTQFRDDKIAHVEVTRDLSHITMPAFASLRALSDN